MVRLPRRMYGGGITAAVADGAVAAAVVRLLMLALAATAAVVTLDDDDDKDAPMPPPIEIDGAVGGKASNILALMLSPPIGMVLYLFIGNEENRYGYGGVVVMVVDSSSVEQYLQSNTTFRFADATAVWLSSAIFKAHEPLSIYFNLKFNFEIC